MEVFKDNLRFTDEQNSLIKVAFNKELSYFANWKEERFFNFVNRWKELSDFVDIGGTSYEVSLTGGRSCYILLINGKKALLAKVISNSWV